MQKFLETIKKYLKLSLLTKKGEKTFKLRTSFKNEHKV